MSTTTTPRPSSREAKKAAVAEAAAASPIKRGGVKAARKLAAKDKPAATAKVKAEPKKTWPSIDGVDIPSGAEVHQPNGDIDGIVKYRVMHGADAKKGIVHPMCGVEPVGAEDGALKINGRHVRRISVDANSLRIGPRPKKRARSK